MGFPTDGPQATCGHVLPLSCKLLTERGYFGLTARNRSHTSISCHIFR